MKTVNYLQMSEDIKKNSGLVVALNVLDKTITYITILLYFLLLFIGINQGMASGDWTLLYRSILIPGISFVVVSIYRRKVSAPRPYEVYGFEPAIKKDTVGKSFPSRHVFSIFMVAMSYMQISYQATLAISILGCALAILRVVGGVHFIKDVLAGAAIGILCGALGFGVLCGVLGFGVLVF